MLYKLLSYWAQPYLFFLLFITLYFFTPLFAYYVLNANEYMLLLAEMSAVSALGLLAGYFLLPGFCQIKPAHLINISGKYFVWFVFLVFLIFLVLIISTADEVPLFLAFKTRNVYELATARANFLKARTGIERLFLYANAILTTSFLPYVILLSFHRAYRLRWYFLAVPYFYSFLTLEKVFFLKFILPFISYCSSLNCPKNRRYAIIGFLSIPLVIYLNTVISGFGSQTTSHSTSTQLMTTPVYQSDPMCHNDASYYSARYSGCANNGRVNFILWRILAVPVFSASDSLKLFEEKYKAHLFWGRTSTLLSALFHVPNIKFERETFNSEWGKDSTGTASANAVFIIEQFVNFGWIGVILSSILVGYIYAILRRSNDIALASMSIALSINLIAGGLISTMLSGGFLALFAFLFFVKLEE